MQGTIVVDAFDLNDLLTEMQASDTVEAWMSAYAFQAFMPEILTSLGQHVVCAERQRGRRGGLYESGAV